MTINYGHGVSGDVLLSAAFKVANVRFVEKPGGYTWGRWFRDATAAAVVDMHNALTGANSRTRDLAHLMLLAAMNGGANGREGMEAALDTQLSRGGWCKHIKFPKSDRRVPKADMMMILVAVGMWVTFADKVDAIIDDYEAAWSDGVWLGARMEERIMRECGPEPYWNLAWRGLNAIDWEEVAADFYYGGM